MQSTATELGALIDQHLAALLKIPRDKMLYKERPGKWSKQEIIGHLVDSAQNNIRRFVVAQYEDRPSISYQQDDWVALSNYQAYDTERLINLWYLLNRHIMAILSNMSAQGAQRICLTGSEHTLEWLANDYVRHLKHHVHQVLDLEAVPYR